MSISENTVYELVLSFAKPGSPRIKDLISPPQQPVRGHRRLAGNRYKTYNEQGDVIKLTAVLKMAQAAQFHEQPGGSFSLN